MFSKEKTIIVNIFSLIGIINFSKPNIKIKVYIIVIIVLVLSILC
jgi:hypothetical protein